MSEIVAGVKKVGDIVAEIAAASVQQSAGIGQVNQAVSQMDEITQQNAALAEEASAASVSMSDLSTNMVELLAFFKTGSRSAEGSHRHTSAGHAGSACIVHAEAVRKPVVASHRQTSYQQNVSSDDEWQDF